MMDTLSLNPTHLAGPESWHIGHVLEQIVRGYICGSNTNRWLDHLMSNYRYYCFSCIAIVLTGVFLSMHYVYGDITVYFVLVDQKGGQM